MVSISQKVILVDKEIMISIKLPKFAVDYIEMLVREVPIERRKF